MRTAAALVAACLAQPALAQWGLHGFSEDGVIYSIDEFTGSMEIVGDIGERVIGASPYRDGWDPHGGLVVLTADDRIIHVNRRDYSTKLLNTLTGRPAGYTPVAFENWDWPSPSYRVVMDSPSGEDFMYRADVLTGVYELVGPLGLNNVVELNHGALLTESGEVYWNRTGYAWSLEYTVHVQEPLQAMSSSYCGMVYLGEGAYQGTYYTGSVRQIAASGLGHITTVTYSNAWNFGCNLDTSTGIAVCDIFDFLAFMDGWINGEPFACECSTNTGTGVCDIFDFLCFQEAWVEGYRVQGRCR